jgi:metal-dependent amidase/aminoacylase/carboxypeptidase family protein
MDERLIGRFANGGAERTILRAQSFSAMHFRSPSLVPILIFGALFSMGQSALNDDDVELLHDVTRAIESARMDLIAVRRDLHSFPEGSGAESRTAAIIAARLRARGLEVRTGVGGHGVVGVLKGSLPGPVIAFRADMDATATTAPDPVEFRSQVPGVRHICGHDIHTTVGLALVDGLSAVRTRLPGTVILVFQPAEETATGAQRMLADGLIDSVRPNEIFAFHTSGNEVGRIVTKSGPMLPGHDQVIVSFRAPSNRSDLAEQVSTNLAALASPDLGSSSPDPFVIVLSRQTQWLSGSGEWRVTGNLMVSSPQAREAARGQLDAALGDLRQRGFSPGLDWQRRIPGVFNNEALEAAIRPVIEQSIGSGSLLVSSTLPTPFSEDFGWFQDQIPGVMYFLGVSNAERGWSGYPHSAGHIADEESIQVGARAMAAVILNRLRAGTASTARKTS